MILEPDGRRKQEVRVELELLHNCQPIHQRFFRVNAVAAAVQAEDAIALDRVAEQDNQLGFSRTNLGKSRARLYSASPFFTSVLTVASATEDLGESTV